tara:strand:- start:15583 stop:15924 length:342 start_codon:yes stop_codon:yes gene_type:complete
MQQVLKAFVLGGATIAAAKYISQFLSPAFAPLIAGMPTGILTSFFLGSDKARREYYSGYVISISILAAIVLFCHLMATYMPNVPIDLVSFIAIPMWGAISYFAINKFAAHKKK